MTHAGRRQCPNSVPNRDQINENGPFPSRSNDDGAHRAPAAKPQSPGPLGSLDCGPAMVPLSDVSSSRHSEPAERCAAEHVIALIRGEYRKDTLVGVV